MKFEGQFKITKRKPGAIIGKIVGIKDLYGSSMMEFMVKDPHSLQDLGKIEIEIPDVTLPIPPEVKEPGRLKKFFSKK